LLDTRSLKGTLKPLTPGHHHLRLQNHRRRAEDAGHRADTVVGPRETPRFLLGALVLEGRRQEGRGGESGREREAVSLNGKDRLSLQLSLITFPTILFSVLSPLTKPRAGGGGLFPGAAGHREASRHAAHVASARGGGRAALAGRDTAARPPATGRRRNPWHVRCCARERDGGFSSVEAGRKLLVCSAAAMACNDGLRA